MLIAEKIDKRRRSRWKESKDERDKCEFPLQGAGQATKVLQYYTRPALKKNYDIKVWLVVTS